MARKMLWTAVCLISLGAGTAQAGEPGGLLRWLGWGWGDGYHAADCAPCAPQRGMFAHHHARPPYPPAKQWHNKPVLFQQFYHPAPMPAYGPGMMPGGCPTCQ